MGIEITPQMIAEYKKLTGNKFLPDFVVSRLIKNAIESGEIPEGFEKLLNDVQTNKKSAESINLFGYGFDDGFVSPEEDAYYKTNPNNINNQDVRANSNKENTTTVHKNTSDKNTGNDIGFSTNKIVYSENLIKSYISKNPELKNNSWLQENIGELLDICNDTRVENDVRQKRFEVFNQILSNPQILANNNTTDSLKSILKCITDENVQEIALKVFSEPKLYENEAIVKNLDFILLSIINDKQKDFVLNIITNDNLTNNNICRNLGDISYNTLVKHGNEIASRVFSDPKLYENETLIDYLGEIMENTNSDKQMEIVSNILSNQELLENKKLLHHLDDILEVTNTKETEEIVDKMLTLSELNDADSLIENMALILRQVHAQGQQEIVLKILSDDKLYKNSKVIKNITNELGFINNQNKKSFILKLLSDKDYFRDRNIMRNFSHLLHEIETSEDKSAVLKILDYLKENKDEDITIRIVNKQTENLHEEVYSLTEDEHNNTKVIFFDENGNFLKTNNVQVTDTLNHEEITNKSGKIVYNADVNPESGKLPILSSRKEVFDIEGNLVYVEKYEQSTDVPNKYNMFREYPDGKIEEIGSAYVASNGDTVIKKNLVHDNGVQTEYVYVESPNGTKFNYTKITDSEGNILLENKYRYKVIDENNFITTENGVEYKIEYKNDEVTVTNNSTGETVTITIGENDDDSSVLSKDLLPLLKEMPGSFYFAIDKYGLEKVGLNIDDVADNNAHYSGENNLIAMSDEVEKESFTFAHEFGHYLDKHINIRNNPEIINTFEKERKNLIENQPACEAIRMNYFIDIKSYSTRDIMGSIGEMIAEVNAFLYDSNADERIELRGQYLQQYFPETFALIAKALTEYQNN